MRKYCAQECWESVELYFLLTAPAAEKLGSVTQNVLALFLFGGILLTINNFRHNFALVHVLKAVFYPESWITLARRH